MTAVLMGLEPTSNRRIYLADSFKGLPKDTDVSNWKSGNDLSSVLGGRIKSSLRGEVGQFNTSRESFESNMAANGFNVSIHKDRIKVLEGFYSKTLPQLKSMNVKLSFLRLDGDIYISTMQALENAYELVQPGGYLYVDDYGSFEGCKRAVDFFKQSIGDNSPLLPIYEDNKGTKFEAVWWRKPMPLQERPNALISRLGRQYVPKSSSDCVSLLFVIFFMNAVILWACFRRKRNL